MDILYTYYIYLYLIVSLSLGSIWFYDVLCSTQCPLLFSLASVHLHLRKACQRGKVLMLLYPSISQGLRHYTQ